MNGFPHDDDDEEEDLEVACSRCGQQGLRLYDTGVSHQRWVLMDGSRRHTCGKQILEDFESLGET